MDSETYSLVHGEKEDEVEMFDFFKQVFVVDGRGVISSFALSVMVSRYWGKGSPGTLYLSGDHCKYREAYDSMDASRSLSNLEDQVPGSPSLNTQRASGNDDACRQHENYVEQWK